MLVVIRVFPEAYGQGFHSLIGRGEMEILNAISTSAGTKPVRVLEAVQFLLCRLDSEVSRQG